MPSRNSQASQISEAMGANSNSDFQQLRDTLSILRDPKAAAKMIKKPADWNQNIVAIILGTAGDDLKSKSQLNSEQSDNNNDIKNLGLSSLGLLDKLERYEVYDLPKYKKDAKRYREEANSLRQQLKEESEGRVDELRDLISERDTAVKERERLNEEMDSKTTECYKLTLEVKREKEGRERIEEKMKKSMVELEKLQKEVEECYNKIEELEELKKENKKTIENQERSYKELLEINKKLADTQTELRSEKLHLNKGLKEAHSKIMALSELGIKIKSEIGDQAPKSPIINLTGNTNSSSSSSSNLMKLEPIQQGGPGADVSPISGFKKWAKYYELEDSTNQSTQPGTQAPIIQSTSLKQEFTDFLKHRYGNLVYGWRALVANVEFNNTGMNFTGPTTGVTQADTNFNNTTNTMSNLSDPSLSLEKFQEACSDVGYTKNNPKMTFRDLTGTFNINKNPSNNLTIMHLDEEGYKAWQLLRLRLVDGFGSLDRGIVGLFSGGASSIGKNHYSSTSNMADHNHSLDNLRTTLSSDEFLHSLREIHFPKAKRVLRYLEIRGAVHLETLMTGSEFSGFYQRIGGNIIHNNGQTMSFGIGGMSNQHYLLGMNNSYSSSSKFNHGNGSNNLLNNSSSSSSISENINVNSSRRGRALGSTAPRSKLQTPPTQNIMTQNTSIFASPQPGDGYPNNQSVPSSGADSPLPPQPNVEKFRKLLIGKYRNLSIAWKRCLDPYSKGSVGFQEFGRVCRDLGYGGSSTVLWKELMMVNHNIKDNTVLKLNNVDNNSSLNLPNLLYYEDLDPHGCALINGFKQLLLNRFGGDLITAWVLGLDVDGNGRVDREEFINRIVAQNTNSLSQLYGNQNLFNGINYYTESQANELFNLLMGDAGKNYLSLIDIDQESGRKYANGIYNKQHLDELRQTVNDFSNAQNNLNQNSSNSISGTNNSSIKASLNNFHARQQAHDVTNFRKDEGSKQKKKVEARDQRRKSLDMAASTKQEFFFNLKRKYGNFPRAWRNALDKDGNGKVTLQEFSQVCREQKMYVGNISKLFKELDFDDSGLLSLEELDKSAFAELENFQNKCETAFGSKEKAWDELVIFSGGLKAIEQGKFGEFCNEKLNMNSNMNSSLSLSSTSLNTNSSQQNLFKYLLKEETMTLLCREDFLVFDMKKMKERARPSKASMSSRSSNRSRTSSRKRKNHGPNKFSATNTNLYKNLTHDQSHSGIDDSYDLNYSQSVNNNSYSQSGTISANEDDDDQMNMTINGNINNINETIQINFGEPIPSITSRGEKIESQGSQSTSQEQEQDNDVIAGVLTSTAIPIDQQTGVGEHGRALIDKNFDKNQKSSELSFKSEKLKVDLDLSLLGGPGPANSSKVDSEEGQKVQQDHDESDQVNLNDTDISPDDNIFSQSIYKSVQQLEQSSQELSMTNNYKVSKESTSTSAGDDTISHSHSHDTGYGIGDHGNVSQSEGEQEQFHLADSNLRLNAELTSNLAVGEPGPGPDLNVEGPPLNEQEQYIHMAHQGPGLHPSTIVDEHQDHQYDDYGNFTHQDPHLQSQDFGGEELIDISPTKIRNPMSSQITSNSLNFSAIPESSESNDVNESNDHTITQPPFLPPGLAEVLVQVQGPDTLTIIHEEDPEIDGELSTTFDRGLRAAQAARAALRQSHERKVAQTLEGSNSEEKEEEEEEDDDGGDEAIEAEVTLTTDSMRDNNINVDEEEFQSEQLQLPSSDSLVKNNSAKAQARAQELNDIKKFLMFPSPNSSDIPEFVASFKEYFDNDASAAWNYLFTEEKEEVKFVEFCRKIREEPFLFAGNLKKLWGVFTSGDENGVNVELTPGDMEEFVFGG